MREELSDYEDVFALAAQSLAEFQEPLFAGISEDRIFEAFSLLFNQNNDDFNAWIQKFMAAIDRQSGGKTTLYYRRFRTGIRGQAATFLLKRDDGRVQPLVIGPYSPAIMFWSSKPEFL